MQPKHHRMKTWLMTMASVATFASTTSTATAQRRGAPKVIELETMVIEGKVAKPQVFYVLGRSRIKYRGIKMDRSFVNRIVESARRNPF